MAGMKQGVRDVRIVFETTHSNFTATDNHWMNRLLEAISKVNNANFAIEIRDEKDQVIRRAESGKPYAPSAEMKRMVIYEFGDDDTEPASA